jgi:glycosyltransferase involved in cell wall biosynthesis
MKCNILLVMPSESGTGLTYHRQLVPHNDLSKDTEYTVSRVNNINALTGEQLKDFHIVHFLREIDTEWKGGSKYTIERLKRLGIKVVFDIDDYWRVDSTHLLYPFFKSNNVSEQVEEIFTLVDMVTTTTSYMAEQISLFTPNVEVLPNAIDTTDEQWQQRKIVNERVRFGWIGGVHHRADLSLMRHSINQINGYKPLRDKYQICLGGFNVVVNFNDNDEVYLKRMGCNIEHMKTLDFVGVTQYLKSKGVNTPVPEYINFERIMTNDYKSVKWDKYYYTYLTKFTQQMEHLSFDKDYRRLWGKDVFNYGRLYNDIDVSLIPLVDNKFNNGKSQLKIIEAGMMGKAAIVSGVMPYTIDCNEHNSIMIEPKNNLLGWFEAMKRLTLDADLRGELAANLHNLVSKKYDIKTVNEKRKHIYQHLIK